MNLHDLDGLNFDLLPADVLKIIRAKIDQSLKRRRLFDAAEVKAMKKICEDVVFRTQINKRGNKQKNSVNFQKLMKEDWSHLFSGSDERRFYVYAHVTPGTQVLGFDRSLMDHFKGIPFYIGKGTGNRAYDLKRNQGHGAILSELIAHGKKESDIVQIMQDGLTEAEAYALEAKLIYFFGTRYERLRNGILVNLDIPKTPY